MNAPKKLKGGIYPYGSAFSMIEGGTNWSHASLVDDTNLGSYPFNLIRELMPLIVLCSRPIYLINITCIVSSFP